jgi:hypothetical protein
MKKTCLFLCCLVLLVLGVFGSANATTFTLDNYDISLNTSDPGLVLDSANVLSPIPYDFNLDLYDYVTVGLFNIWTDESSINSDDLAHSDIEVAFNFSAPAPPFGGDIDGETFGIKALGGFYQAGRVVWDSPVTFYFGKYGDGELVGSLSPETFNEGYLWGTGCKGATVELTLSYQKAATVPEPATMLLLGIGLFGLAAVGRKKFFQKG